MKLKYKNTLFWLVIYGALFTFLQFFYEYNLYFREQNQLFQHSWFYISSILFVPGGFVNFLSEFFIQFFLHPFVGAAITAFLILIASYLTFRIIKLIAPLSNLIVISLLPAISLLFMLFDYSYMLSGIIAFVLMLFALYFAFLIKSYTKRLLAHALLTIVLYYLGGPIYVLYALTVTIYEILNKSPRSYLVLFILFEAMFLGLLSIRFSIFGEYRLVFLPDGYYHHTEKPGYILYFSWIFFLGLVFLAFLCRKCKVQSSKKKQVANRLIQFILLAVFCCWGVTKYDNEQARIIKFYYFSHTGQWDKILERSRGYMTNYMHICFVNMALAQKGELADKMFFYDQHGVQGLIIPNWSGNTLESLLSSDVYFTMNNVAMSQRMAFEAYILDNNPSMLKRLVQTNIIYGEYPVAEKYIDILKNTYGYCDWANEHAKFLYNDTKVENDLLLNQKRQSLLKKSTLFQIDGFVDEMERIIENNPSVAQTTLEYLGAFFLLAKDIEKFASMIDTYYGTEVLLSLPVSFQEAVLLVSLNNSEPDYLKRFNIPDKTVQLFNEYKSQTAAYKDNINMLPGHLKQTFWYYYMYK